MAEKKAFPELRTYIEGGSGVSLGPVLLRHVVQHIDDQAAEIERLRAALLFVQTWANAYPLESFPEPHRFEWQQAAALLSENGISIGSLSASNMRHVITVVKRAVDHGLTGNDPGAIGPQGASA